MRVSIATWNMDNWKRNNKQRSNAWIYLTETVCPDIALVQEFVPTNNNNSRYNIIYREIGDSY